MDPALLALIPRLEGLSPEELSALLDSISTRGPARGDPNEVTSEPFPQRVRYPEVRPGFEGFDDDQLEAISRVVNRPAGPPDPYPDNLDGGVETLHPPYVQAKLTDAGVNTSEPIRQPPWRDPALNEYEPIPSRFQSWVRADSSAPEASILNQLRDWASSGPVPEQVRDPSGFGLVPPQPRAAPPPPPRQPAAPPPMAAPMTPPAPSSGPGPLPGNMVEDSWRAPMLLPGQQPWSPSPRPAPAPRVGGGGGGAPRARPLVGPPKTLMSKNPRQAGMEPWLDHGGQFAMEEHDAASQRGMDPRAPIATAPSGRQVFSARTERPELQTRDSLEQAKRRERELLLRQRGFGARGEPMAPMSRDVMSLFDL